MKPDPDAVQSFNLPVPSRPKPVFIRILEILNRFPDSEDPTIEAYAIIRRRQLAVIDFYKGRPT